MFGNKEVGTLNCTIVDSEKISYLESNFKPYY